MLESYKTPEGYARRCIGQWIFAVREWVITCIQHDILSIKAYGVELVTQCGAIVLTWGGRVA